MIQSPFPRSAATERRFPACAANVPIHRYSRVRFLRLRGDNPVENPSENARKGLFTVDKSRARGGRIVGQAVNRPRDLSDPHVVHRPSWADTPFGLALWELSTGSRDGARALLFVAASTGHRMSMRTDVPPARRSIGATRQDMLHTRLAGRAVRPAGAGGPLTVARPLRYAHTWLERGGLGGRFVNHGLGFCSLGPPNADPSYKLRDVVL